MNEKWTIAESQFDSLLSLPGPINRDFLVSGLEVKLKLNRNVEVIRLLGEQDKSTIHDLCDNGFLKDLPTCVDLKRVKPQNESLQIELIKMYINDQYVRSNLMTELIEKYDFTKPEVIIDSFGMSTDETNTNRLKEIIEEFGFPTKALVGKDAMDGVFIIIQHSIDIEWQKSQLLYIENAVKNRDMDEQDYAYLYDRIKMRAGEPQLYGTQFEKVDRIKKTLELADTADLENLDQRRREIGLMPIAMYKRVVLNNI